MAGNTVNINLNVRDTGNSIKDRTADARGLNKELEKTVAHSKAASRAMAASENIEYGRSRGAMGATGASARDFANQAQGLGGLVRLYATWAANIFAVTAAFRALSEAMNVQNMIQGLDQLGAAQGVSLGSLSKRFADATGGALSLKESMEAVVKASSSGLGEADIMKLNQVALKASQALGLNMSDAVSRLTRGITKLEPELLDELGLFTKTGKASEDYARKIGKTADSLTDLEKRQAFANAVLAEGLEKFGTINIPTNPYDKLAASLKNLGIQILSVVNTVIAPLVDLLSSSPTALFAAVGLFTASIVKQAIPVLRSWGASLDAAAKRSKEFYEGQAEAANKAREARINAIKQEKELQLSAIEDRRYLTLQRQEQQFESAFDKKRLQRGVRDILAKDIQDITDKEVAYLDKLGKRTKLYADLAQSIRGVKKINEDIVNLETEANNKINQRPGLLTAAGIAATNAEKARQRAAASALISTAAADTGEVGSRQAFSNLMKGIRDEKLNRVPGILTAIGGAATIAAAKVAALFGVLSRGLGVFAVLFGAYELLSAILSKNSKETEQYTRSLEDLEEKTKTATDTAKKYGDTLSVQGILARANALDALSESIGASVQNLKIADQTASGFDRFIDGFLRFIGKGLQDKFADTMAPAIIAGLNSFTDPKFKKQAEEGVAEVLGTTGSLTISRIGTLLKQVEDPEKVLGIGEALSRIFKSISQEASKAAKPLKEVQDGFKGLEKSYLDLSNTFIDRSPLALFAQELGKQAGAMAEAFKDPQNRIALLKEILEDTSKIRMFPPESQTALLAAGNDLKTYTSTLALAKQRQETFRQDMLAYRSITDPFGQVYGGDPVRFNQAQRNFDEEQKIIDLTQQRIASVQQELTKAISAAINSSLNIIYKGIDIASRKAVIDTQQALIGYLPKSKETVQLAVDLELQSISLRKEELQSIQDLIRSQELLRLELELSRLKTEAADVALAGGDTSTIIKAQSAVRQEIEAYSSPEAVRLRGQAGEIITPGTQAVLTRTAGMRRQNIELEAQRQMAIVKGQLQSVEAEVEQRVQREQNALLELKTRNAKFFSENIEFRQMSAIDQKQERSSREAQERDQAALVEQTQLNGKLLVLERLVQAAREKGFAQLEKAGQSAIDTLTRETVAKTTNTKATNDATTAETNRAIAIERIITNLDRLKEKSDMDFKFAEQRSSLESSLLTLQRERLDINNNLGNLTEQDYINQSRVLESLQLQSEYNSKTATIRKQSQDADLEFEKRIAALGENDVQEFFRLAELRDRSKEYYSNVLEGERLLYEAKLRNKQLNESLTERQKSYDQIFKNTFSGLADAIVNWAETGKLAGKDLFNSLIADVARYELRLQTLQVYQSVRPGLLNLLLGSRSTPGGEGAAGGVFNQDYSMMSQGPYAKGGVFNYGIEKFAKGGMFTNSIVTQPTLFKFARGTGLMGEAGPEAIMPLRRDGSGNLGVIGQQGKTEVVINNYSSEKAEAKETMDSRGNRKIEVLIGEAAAADISTSGSSSQRSLRNTFGIAPQLIRR
jgi:lambda family phage tail tape measure protein